MAVRDRAGAPNNTDKPKVYCAIRGGYYEPFQRLNGSWACGGCGGKVRVVA